MPGPLDNLYTLKNCRSKRISSYDRTGGNADCLSVEPGETAVIAEIGCPGIIRHMWFTIACQDDMIRRNGVLRMYWDGEEHPSVECPIGDFFGQGWGERYNFTSLPLAAAPKEGNAFNCYFPMPFNKSAKITFENQSEFRVDCLYFYIDYEEHDHLPPDTAMFHACWNREITDPDPVVGENEWCLCDFPYQSNKDYKDNYQFADIEGKGHFVGINYYVDNPSPLWYGEGDDMWMIDGEQWPGSLHGTGTEDFFNSAWCPNEVYNHPYFGTAKVPDTFQFLGRTHCYRFFLEDPIYFEKSLKASIEHGHANCMILDISSVAYWYQTEPHKVFPTLPPKEQRQNMPRIDMWEVHRWRIAWRESMGNTKLWGHEKKEKGES